LSSITKKEVKKGLASKNQDPISCFCRYVTLIFNVTGVLIFPALSVAWAVIVWPLPLQKLSD
jgi:hypothetical protein